MAWSTPRLWTTGEIVTASMMNTYVSDDLSYLKGAAGSITHDAGASFNGNLSAAGTFTALSTITSTAGGGSFTGQISNMYNGGATSIYSVSQLLIQAAAGNAVGIGFHESGSTAATLYKAVGSEQPRWRGNGGADYQIILDTAAATMSNKTLSAPLINNGNITSGYLIANRRAVRHPQAYEAMIQTGAGSHGTVGGDNVSGATVSFGEAFDSAPFFIIMNNTTVPGTATQHCQFNVRSGWTNTQFTYDVANSNSTTSSALTFSWLAIGQKAS